MRSKRFRPSSSTKPRWEMARACLAFCSTMSTAVPARGCSRSAMAISRICCWPPERCRRAPGAWSRVRRSAPSAPRCRGARCHRSACRHPSRDFPPRSSPGSCSGPEARRSSRAGPPRSIVNTNAVRGWWPRRWSPSVATLRCQTRTPAAPGTPGARCHGRSSAPAACVRVPPGKRVGPPPRSSYPVCDER